MKNTIVFRVEVDEEESYGALANFIYKREHSLNLTSEEVRFVTYKYYLDSSYESYSDWAKAVSRDSLEFISINHPENIKNITEKYEVIYCLRVREDADIVDIHNLFLIKHYYHKLKIFVLYEEYNSDQFFTISQFLYRVNNQDKSFYDSCYFVNKGKAKRAQLNNIDFSRRFIPLQIVDKDNYNRLFQNIRELLDENDIHRILTEDALESAGEEGDLLQGAVMLLHDQRKTLARVLEKPLIRIIQEMDVFSFILLCYAALLKKDIFNISVLEQYAYEMQQYSGAIRQLAENIVFHSRTGFGVIAFRIHVNDSVYMEKQYNISQNRQKNHFLEVLVSDFCGDEPSENIAENFIANLEDDRIREGFKKLCPKAFFIHTDNGEAEAVWEHFYQNPDNIGKHFGLRIFQSIVTTFKGFFGAESHKGYTNQHGESFFSYKAEEYKDCMPGTRYHIVLPVELFRDVIKKQDLSLDSGISISRNIKSVLSYRVDDMELELKGRDLQSQLEKNEQIVYFSEFMQKSIKEKECDILYISLNNVEEGIGEIFAKALVIALYHSKKNVTVVCYQCSDNTKSSIFNTLRIFFQNADIEGMFLERKNQIVLYSKDFEETVVALSSAHNTDNINAYLAHMKCISAAERLDKRAESTDLSRGAESYIPCDVLYEVEISGKRQTLFEHYTEVILSRNIQRSDFGCKLEHTHMRLGSTIHIDEFYEAEILFGNKLFVSRFALLLVKDMIEEIKDIEKLTLYGYGTYSETVLVQMVEMIQNFYPQKEDVDYIILEREEERRGFLHKDRIRYNRLFQSREERIEYYRERKIAIVVLINSTLKTHVRLINLFKDENEKMQDEDWPIRNYAVLLVGSSNERNQYWKISDEKRVELQNGKIYPAPRYFIQLQVDYEEPLRCGYCFPTNPMAETPLIEVNAASTIPNQAFGVAEGLEKNSLKIDYPWIQKEEKQLECLKGEFIYGHVQRNENHFLYYFKTENIWMSERKKIRNSLRTWREQHREIDGDQYHIIVAPMHYSNAGFVEMVNDVVFGGNAILLRIDFDKEYRCNAYAKFSYLRSYMEQLRSSDLGGIIYVHYVDDAIVSGRTFHRAKSLVESVLEINQEKEDAIEIQVFDKVFVLVDRNSIASRMQYARCKEDFYAFIHVNISSLRNYGDSCVFCNLKKESDLLWDMASTEPIAEYWERCGRKFQLYTLEEYGERQRELDEERERKDKENKLGRNRAFRRLFCTHMAQCVLEEKYHGNDKVQTLYLILKLLNTDYASRADDRYEYFLSYLKCISRPFLVFKKSVKEAVFDILLLLIDAVVRKEKLRKIIEEVSEKKDYLRERRLVLQFNKLDKNVLNSPERTEGERRDLVKLLMKQLTELKSNYIIRPEKMDAIFAFMDGIGRKEFEVYYMSLIDRLVGASSDTNKSIWLDEQMEQAVFQNVSLDYREWVVLENTRAFRDGIEKLYIKRNTSKEFCQLSDRRIDILKEDYNYYRAQEMFKYFMVKNKAELEEYGKAKDLESETAYSMKERIQRFIKSLPELTAVNFRETAESLSKTDANWSRILKREEKIMLMESEAARKGDWKKKIREGLQSFIIDEADIYQYSNFYKILDRDTYMDGLEVTPDGIDMIVCCTKVLALCRDKDLGILEKVRELTTLFRVIVQAQKVQFIVENRDDNHLNEWKRNIEGQYNAIVEKWNESNKDSVPKIHITEKEHYTVIVEKSGFEDYNTEVSEVTEGLLDRLRTSEGGQRNYILDRRSGSVIWKLENKQRSIWVNIEKSEWCAPETGQELKMARDVRRVMMFYQELKSEIFSPENDDFINEIFHISKELSIYNSNKVYTHTKDYSQIKQFWQVADYIDKGGGENLEVYPYYVLNLLADMNVSKYYRNGLKKKFSTDDKVIKKPAVWGDAAKLLGDGKEFVYRSDKKGEVSVQLRVYGIDYEEEILCRAENPDAIREFTLLIYALILNAAERGRGKRQIKKGGVQSEEGSVIVDLFKEEGALVIENECDESVDVERVKRLLSQVPGSEEDGISLWSFNCYIKRCINAFIMARIKDIDMELAENQADAEQICHLGEWITKLTGEEYKIWPEQCERDGKKYFRVKLPIFMEKYRWSMNQERRAE